MRSPRGDVTHHNPEKLLEPGWAGALTLQEALYIQEVLSSSERHRKKWFPKKRKSYPLLEIARKALPDDPTTAAAHIRGLMDLERRRK